MKTKLSVTFKNCFLSSAGIIALVAFASFSGLPLVGLFLFFVFSAYLLIISARSEDKKYSFLPLSLLFLIGVAGAKLLFVYTQVSAYLFPVAFFSMLVALLYHDLELALIFSVSLSVFVGLIYGGDLYLCCVLLIGGILGAIFVWQARRRSKIVTAGFLVGLAQAICVLTLFRRIGVQSPSFLKFCFIPFLNGIVASFLVTGLLPVFEFIFKVFTNISLLELADFNHPLLKRLVLEAPGTYHHV